MIEENKYVPILKGKDGEFTALNKLASDIKDGIIPIIDLVPNNSKKIENHAQSILRYFKKWDKHRLIYIDGYMLNDSVLLPDNSHPVENIFRNLIADGFNVMPVLSNVNSIDFNLLLKNIAISINKGIAIRIFVKPSQDINSEIEAILNILQFDPSQIDLIIDLRSLIEAEIIEKLNHSLNILDNLKYLNNWRSLILSGGNFPIDLSELAPDQVHSIPRKQWQIWQSIATKKPDRIPNFSDYAISHPSISEILTEQINASASIRYTHEENFYVYRGRGTRQYGYSQFYDISETLINNNNHFYGVNHCEGDKFIDKCAVEKKKKGNLTTWRWVGTVHHLTVVVNQLRQFLRDLSV